MKTRPAGSPEPSRLLGPSSVWGAPWAGSGEEGRRPWKASPSLCLPKLDWGLGACRAKKGPTGEGQWFCSRGPRARVPHVNKAFSVAPIPDNKGAPAWL